MGSRVQGAGFKLLGPREILYSRGQSHGNNGESNGKDTPKFLIHITVESTSSKSQHDDGTSSGLSTMVTFSLRVYTGWVCASRFEWLFRGSGFKV